MKKWSIIASSVLIVVFLVYVFLNTKIKQPEYIGVKSFSYNLISERELMVNIDLAFKNNNNFKALLINSNFKVSVDDVQIGSVSQTNVTKIDAMDTFNIPLVFKIDPLKFGLSQGVSGVLSMALDSERKIEARFTGYCRVKVSDEIYEIPVDVLKELKIN